MAATVSDVLAERAAAGEPPRLVVGLLSAAAHAAFFGMLIFMSRPRPLTVVPLSLPVRVISPSALARLGAAAAASAVSAAPAPAPVTAAPTASLAAAKPVIEKPAEKPRPSEKALPLPSTKKEKERAAVAPKAKGPPAPERGASRPGAGPVLDLPAANGSGGEGGTAGSAAGFGAAISFFDADFPFAYYVEQLQALIGANWLKPPAPDQTAVVLAFKILRSGQVTDVKIETPSGVSVYDRAASRAIYAANPLPPLPPEYRGDALGVHIRFQ
jgi:TonB family protein